MARVFVRADGGRGIGLGHLVRTGALGTELQRAGHRVIYLVRECDGVARRLVEDRFPVVRLVEDLFDPVTGRSRAPSAPREWLVLDRYGWGTRVHRALRRAGWRVLCMEDGRARRCAADLVVNQNLGADRLRYRVPRDTRLLLGSRFALLRPEFQHRPPTRRTFPVRARRVLVTFGGSDPEGLSGRILKILRRIASDAEIRVVIGPSGRAPEGLRRSEAVRSATAARMRSLMEWCDLAVTAPASTCWELAYLGVPMAVLGYADNQRSVHGPLCRSGLALDLGWNGRTRDAALADRLSRILRDPVTRRRMSGLGRRAVDGQGVVRVRRAMGL